jgi:antitoxin ParD1/3/4
MATMKVSLPDAMLAWVEGQTRSGRCPNASEYVRDLIRRDQDRADGIDRLQRLVDEGLGAGGGAVGAGGSGGREAVNSTPYIWGS